MQIEIELDSIKLPLIDVSSLEELKFGVYPYFAQKNK